MGTPTYPKLHVRRLVPLHPIASLLSVLSADHLDKGMAFVHIYDACLDYAELGEDLTKLIIGTPVPISTI